MVVNNINDNNFSVSDWFNSLPFVTRCWFGCTVALTLVGNFGIIDPAMFMWSWSFIRTKFELWRVITSFCYAGPFAFPTLISICEYSLSISNYFFICLFFT